MLKLQTETRLSHCPQWPWNTDIVYDTMYVNICHTCLQQIHSMIRTILHPSALIMPKINKISTNVGMCPARISQLYPTFTVTCSHHCNPKTVLAILWLGCYAIAMGIRDIWQKYSLHGPHTYPVLGNRGTRTWSWIIGVRARGLKYKSQKAWCWIWCG